jgi:hypothetical protein
MYSFRLCALRSCIIFRLNSRWVLVCVIMVSVCIVYLCFLMWRMCVCMCAQVIMELQTEPGVG